MKITLEDGTFLEGNVEELMDFIERTSPKRVESTVSDILITSVETVYENVRTFDAPFSTPVVKGKHYTFEVILRRGGTIECGHYIPQSKLTELIANDIPVKQYLKELFANV